MIGKMKLNENSQKAKVMEYGFDNIFNDGPTPTPSAIDLGQRKSSVENKEDEDKLIDLDALDDDMDDMEEDDMDI